MIYNAKDIAKYVIAYCNNIGKPISNLQLQKILYYIQGYFFKEFDHAAYNEEICSWKFGPVIPAVYFEYNVHGGRPILLNANNFDSHNNFKKNKDDLKLINEVINNCLRYTAAKLVDKTHSEDPWKNSDNKKIIEQYAIQNYFLYNDPLNLNRGSNDGTDE